MAQAGWGFAYEFRSRVFAAILKQFRDRVERWDNATDNAVGDAVAVPRCLQ